VVAHQTICVHDPVESGANQLEHAQPFRAIDVIHIDILAPITTRSDVVQRAWEFDSKGARHDPDCQLCDVSMQDLTPNFPPDPPKRPIGFVTPEDKSKKKQARGKTRP